MTEQTWHCTEGHDSHATQQEAFDCEQAAQRKHIAQLAKENDGSPGTAGGEGKKRK